LDRSALQAREALAFAATDKLGGVSSYSSLGSLLLLTQIPRAALENDRDLAAIAGLERSRSGVDDLALLVAYCETASMRQTGERLFMHHSSVEYRLRRIEAMLGFSVATPTGRFRALLAATVHRLSQTTQR
jgi:sugar diacid utilization regulator